MNGRHLTFFGNRALLGKGIVVFAALLFAMLILDRALGGRLPTVLPVFIAAWVALLVTSREFEARKLALEAAKETLEERVRSNAVELEQRDHELAVMARVGTVVNASLDLSHVFEQFIEAAHDLIPFDMASIALYSEDGTSLHLTRVRYLPDGSTCKESLDEVAGFSIHAAARPQVIDDLRDVGEFPGKEMIMTLGVQCAAQVPLTSKGRRLGAFNAGTLEIGRLTQEHVRLMERMAESLALAIDNCRLYDEMRRMAETDGLTGLPNRRAVARLIAGEITVRGERGEMFSVLVLDIDNFKVFNDTLGHQAGDELLTNFSRILRDACREGDVVARQAGDEFTILLPGSGPREATAVAQRIHDALGAADLTYPGQNGVVVRTSIGIAVYPMDGEDDDVLLIMADRAMYAAKAAGGGQSRLASRLTDREAKSDTSRQLRFGMLETLANRLAARQQRGTGEAQAFAAETARAAWAIGERLALDDSEQQLLRVAALAHGLGILPQDDPRAKQQVSALDEGLDDLCLKIGRVFVAGSPGLIDALRVLAQHHRPTASQDDAPTRRYARILRVAERYAELTLTGTPTDAALEALRRDGIEPELVQMLEEGLNLPAVWRAA